MTGAARGAPDRARPDHDALRRRRVVHQPGRPGRRRPLARPARRAVLMGPDASWRGRAGRSSTPPATACWPRSTDRPEPSGAAWRSSPTWATLASTCAAAPTPPRWSGWPATSPASACTSAPGWRPWPNRARSSSRGPGAGPRRRVRSPLRAAGPPRAARRARPLGPVRGHRVSGVRYVFADGSLDTGRYELRRGERAVHVEPQVFDVLAPPGRPPRPRRDQGRAARRGLGRPVRVGVGAHDADQAGAPGRR